MKKVLASTDKLHGAIRKLKKENELLNEDINGRFSMLQGKWKIESSQLLDHFTHFR